MTLPYGVRVPFTEYISGLEGISGQAVINKVSQTFDIFINYLQTNLSFQ